VPDTSAMAYPDLSFSLCLSGLAHDSQHRFATESPPEDHGADIAAKDHLGRYAARRLAMQTRGIVTPVCA
jgi:hypothetical protein